jgi:hypothetical protein
MHWLALLISKLGTATSNNSTATLLVRNDATPPVPLTLPSTWQWHTAVYTLTNTTSSTLDTVKGVVAENIQVTS